MVGIEGRLGSGVGSGFLLGVPHTLHAQPSTPRARFISVHNELATLVGIDVMRLSMLGQSQASTHEHASQQRWNEEEPGVRPWLEHPDSHEGAHEAPDPSYEW